MKQAVRGGGAHEAAIDEIPGSQAGPGECHPWPSNAESTESMTSHGLTKNSTTEFAILLALRRWHDRYVQPKALKSLNDDQLTDIGLTRVQAREEASKPFWR